jgi:hypothetical protein
MENADESKSERRDAAATCSAWVGIMGEMDETPLILTMIL